MPAKSTAQQRWAAMCEHNRGNARKPCPSKAVAREFAKTPRKGLPQHVKKKGR